MQAYDLDSAIDSIRLRFGNHALTRAAELPAAAPWSTGGPLDSLTGIGGLPRGRLSLFTGSGTCGKLTVALSLLARATHDFAHATVIDPGGFDPWSLLPFSPELRALTVVSAQALEICGESAAALARAGVGFILLMSSVPEHWLGPIESGANRSGSVLVNVVDSPDRALAHASSFSVGFSRARWLWERDQLVGLRVTARCTKNRVAAPLGEAALDIRYPLSARQPRDYRAEIVDAPVENEEVLPRASAAG